MGKNKNILIFDYELDGHYLEYIHHLYEGATRDKANNYIIALPEGFSTKGQLTWHQSDNIKFHVFRKLILPQNKVMRSFELAKFAKRIARQYNVDEIFFVTLMNMLPGVALITKSSIKMSGIIYLIYLYRWKESNIKLKFEDSVKYLFLSKRKQFKTIFLLNDKVAPKYLNRKFKTKVFQYLPDPFMPIEAGNLPDIRTAFNIPASNIVYLHMGTMSVRKGTLKILDAIELIEEKDLINKTFIFAGKISPDIKNEFYKKFAEQQKRVQLLCFDQFCDYSFLGALCKAANYLLLPYENTSMSSGIIGYGAQFKKPVVVPGSGLLGKLVRRGKLGYLLKENSKNEIANFVRKSDMNLYPIEKAEEYLKRNTVDNFIQTIFCSFQKED